MTHLTDRTYAVAWDGGGMSDEPVFNARLQLMHPAGAPCQYSSRPQHTADIHLMRWNGFVCPFFSREEMDRYMAWQKDLPADLDDAYSRLSWDGDTLVEHDPQYPDDDTRLDPVDGLYPLGAFGWTWSVIDPDIDPEDLIDQDECDAIGADGRDGRGTIVGGNLTPEETATLVAYRKAGRDAYWHLPDGTALRSLRPGPEVEAAEARMAAAQAAFIEAR